MSDFHEARVSETFEIPEGLLQRLQVRASALGMSRAAFYRYALAKAVGLTEAESLGYALPTNVSKMRRRLISYALDAGNGDTLVTETGVELGLDADDIPLTDIAEKVNISAVVPPLKDLLARLKAVAKQRGKKAALARFLNVSPPMVSRWLSGENEPSGNVALLLLDWVASEERSQNKSSGSVSAPPERKPRLKPNENQEVQSEPEKH